MTTRSTKWHRYRAMLPYVAREWRRLGIISLVTLASAGVSALMPWPMKLLVDHALGGEALGAGIVAWVPGSAPTAAELVVAAGIASLALYAVSTALHWGITWNWAIAGYRMLYHLAADMFGRLQQLSLIFHGRRSVGDLLSRMSGDSWCVYKLAADLLVSPVQDIVTILAIGAVAWSLDPLLTGLLLVVTPALVAAGSFFGQRIKRRSQGQREAEARIAGFAHQVLTAIPIVKTFLREDWNRRHFAALGRDAALRSQQATLAAQGLALVSGIVVAVSSATVLLVGSSRVLSGALSVGSLLVFIAYAHTLRSAFGSLLATWGKVKSTEASIDRVLEVLEAEDTVVELPQARPFVPRHEREGPSRARIAPSRRDGAQRQGCASERPGIAVAFHGVSFGYEPDRPVLRNIDLQVEAGETIALVGSSGAGKTTLASLVPRFFDPWQGSVSFDGIDLRQLTLHSLRRQVALVLQEPFLLPLTVAENIAYGRPEASRDEIVAAAVAANADAFITALPQGYDTVIGERGATLSGGQRQRLAIARAVLKDAPILILDEPTSALDAATETAVVDALARLMARRTTFIIAHRLSTIRHAHRIVVLDSGRIVELGTHQALMHRHGHFRALVDAMAQSQEVGDARALPHPG